MEKRRKKAGKLFAKDYSAPEVARRSASPGRSLTDGKVRGSRAGVGVGEQGAGGPKSKLTAEQTQQVTQALLTGPAAYVTRRPSGLCHASRRSSKT